MLDPPPSWRKMQSENEDSFQGIMYLFSFHTNPLFREIRNETIHPVSPR
jgi:hypothetical protein